MTEEEKAEFRDKFILKMTYPNGRDFDYFWKSTIEGTIPEDEHYDVIKFINELFERRTKSKKGGASKSTPGTKRGL